MSEGYLKQREEAVVEAQRQHQAAATMIADLKARRRALDAQEDALNLPTCPLPISERATQLWELGSQSARLEIELRLARQAEEQGQVRRTETHEALAQARRAEVQLRDQIASAEDELQRLLNSECPPPSIALFRVRVERDLAGLRARYTALVGEDEVPLEAA